MMELGVVAPVVTPCNSSGEPDMGGLRSVCENILLKHEGETPGWIVDNAKRAIGLLQD